MKKLNRKGFTLVELLAVVVILLAISVIAVSSISAAIERNKAKQDNTKIDILLSYAKLYYEEHKNTEADNCIGIGDLIGEFDLDEETTKTNGEPIQGVIKHNNGKGFTFDDSITSCP